MKQLLIVGEAPNRSSDPGSPLDSPKLTKLVGVSREAFLATTERMNLLDAWPGICGSKGAKFPMEAARDAAAKVSLASRTALFVGKRVAAAFGIKRPEFFMPNEFGGGLVMVMPHYSGIVRFWNDPANVLTATAAIHAWWLLAVGEQEVRSCAE